MTGKLRSSVLVFKAADDFSGEDCVYAADFRTLEQAHAALLALVDKHGICTKCGELFEHDYDAPFASCGCCTAEWHTMTPHMTAVMDAKESS